MNADYDVQPLDDIMKKRGLKNDDLVAASTEQLTHKQVQKARLGRRVTPNIKGKILRALVACTQDSTYSIKMLFDY